MRVRSGVLLVGFALLTPAATHAQAVITEVMYDLPGGSDAGREWIEIYNGGTTPIDVTQLRVYENGTNHKITDPNGARMLPAGAYAVIASTPQKFSADWPAYAGPLYDSAFSLSNSGEIIELRDTDLNRVDSFSYKSAMGGQDGNTLNRVHSGGDIMSRAPSPGAAMSASALPALAAKSTGKVAKASAAGSIARGAGAAANDEKHDTAVGSTQSATPSELPAKREDSIATAAAFVRVSPLWALCAVLLALFAAAAAAMARRASKQEWVIEDGAE